MMEISLNKYSLFNDQNIGPIKLLSQQGFSNQNYTFQTLGTTYLLRRFMLQDRDRELEYNVQALAYEKDIAAKPLILDLDNSLMVCEFLKGEHRNCLTRNELKTIVTAIKKLHCIKLDRETMDIKKLFTMQNKNVKDAFAIVETYPKEIVLCHNDLNAKNILFQDSGVKFIDWEFAGNNDLYFDLACFSVEFDLSVIDEAYVLANYFLMNGWEKEKLEAYKVIYRALCKQWFSQLATPPSQI